MAAPPLEAGCGLTVCRMGMTLVCAGRLQVALGKVRRLPCIASEAIAVST